MARTRQNEQIKNDLLNKGIEIFIDQGYHGTGIQEVVDKVGIPKGSFYNYFKSKEDYGSEVIRHYSDIFKSLLIELVEESETDAISALSRMFDYLIKEFKSKNAREGCLLGNFAAEISDGSELGRKTIHECTIEWRDLMEEMIVNGQEQKSIRGDINSGDTADFLFNSLEGSVLRMKIEADTFPIKQFKEIFFNYIEEK